MSRAIADTVASAMRALEAADRLSAAERALRRTPADSVTQTVLDAYKALDSETVRQAVELASTPSATQSILDAYKTLNSDPVRDAMEAAGLGRTHEAAEAYRRELDRVDDLARSAAFLPGRYALDPLEHASPAVLASALGYQPPSPPATRAFGDIDPVAADQAPTPPALPRPAPAAFDDVPALGARVRARRRELGLTQQAFADLAGVGRRFIVELEGGKPTLEIGRVLKVCQAAGLRLLVD